MRFRERFAASALLAVAVMPLGTACSRSGESAPAAPSPVVSRPTAEPPSLTCPSTITIAAATGNGSTVSYELPDVAAGERPVTVTCRPEPGSLFAIGSTQVDCTATDAFNRVATCSFALTVNDTARLRLTRIVAFGDSITEGQVVKPGTEDADAMPARDPYPAVLQRLINARYPNQTITVTNAGKAGEKAVDALARFGGTLGLFRAEAVIILEGINDLYSGTLPDSIENALRGIGALAAEARNRGVRVYLCTLTPTRPGRKYVPIGIVQAANARIRDGARGEGAQLIDLFTPLLADVNNNIGSDGLHPTELGYQRMAEAIFAALRADLEVR